MKTLIITVILFIIFSVGLFAQPVQKLSTIQQAKALIEELNTELKLAKQSNSDLSNKLEISKQELAYAETRVQDVQKTADILKEWGVEQEAKAFAWMEKFNKAIKRYHFLKNITGIIAAFYGLLLGLSCMKYVPPVYGAYAYALPVIGAILGFWGVWLFL